MTSLLPSPQPASTSWPAGWQGHGTFDADVQRLASLADRLYRQGKHVPTDLIEAGLEMIGVRLRTERPPSTDLPAARTGWRYPPTRREAGGIAATTASCLSTLMGSAFDAGFDRRALSTGLRILASTTASVGRADRDGTLAYTNALIQFTLDKSLHGFEASSVAGATEPSPCSLASSLNATSYSMRRAIKRDMTAKSMRQWKTSRRRWSGTRRTLGASPQQSRCFRPGSPPQAGLLPCLPANDACTSSTSQYLSLLRNRSPVKSSAKPKDSSAAGSVTERSACRLRPC